MMPETRILFMGTPAFAVPSLEKIIESGYSVPAVVTTPDKPAGRGKRMQMSAVKQFALARGLRILQPEDLTDQSFLETVKSLSPDIITVVAFRKLPYSLFSLADKGAFNLHASLLPQYRGAAPIQWSVINGEKETGLTTFLLDDSIDTGKIIHQQKINISDDDNAGTLHDKMMVAGAEFVLKTIKTIIQGKYIPIDQSDLIQNSGSLNKAPRIFLTDCRINWSQNAKQVHNHIRGLSPYPGAFTELETDNRIRIRLKIFKSRIASREPFGFPGALKLINQKEMLVSTGDGMISIEELQLEGKQKLTTEQFLAGFRISGSLKFI